jgi:hypothetical protein
MWQLWSTEIEWVKDFALAFSNYRDENLLRDNRVQVFTRHARTGRLSEVIVYSKFRVNYSEGWLYVCQLNLRGGKLMLDHLWPGKWLLYLRDRTKLKERHSKR